MYKIKDILVSSLRILFDTYLRNSYVEILHVRFICFLLSYSHFCIITYCITSRIYKSAQNVNFHSSENKILLCNFEGCIIRHLVSLQIYIPLCA